MLEAHLSTCSDAFWHFSHAPWSLCPHPGRRLYSLGLQFPVPTGGHLGTSLEAAAAEGGLLPSGNDYSVHCCFAAPNPLTKPSSPVIGSGVRVPAVPCSL